MWFVVNGRNAMKTISIIVEATEDLSLADRSSEEVAAEEASVAALSVEEASAVEEQEANSNFKRTFKKLCTTIHLETYSV